MSVVTHAYSDSFLNWLRDIETKRECEYMFF